MTNTHSKRAGLALLLTALLLLCGCTVSDAPVAKPTPEPEEALYESFPAYEPEAVREPVQASREPVGGEVTVSTVDELLAAIASDTTVRLEPGVYDLSVASDYGTLYEGGWYTWEEANDGYALVIDEVENFALLGTGAAEVTICAIPRYANVLTFRDCAGLDLSGFTAGHTEEPGQCSGGVLCFEDTDDTSIVGCALYGCGILGIEAVNCENLVAENTSIYDCSYGAVQIESGRDIRLLNCDIYDCEGYGIFQFLNTYGAAVVNCDVYENDCATLLDSRYSQEVYLLGTGVSRNRFSCSLFAAENHSPVIDDCSFEENDFPIWYGGSVYGLDNSTPVEAVSPEGIPLTSQDLDIMIRKEATYEGPAPAAEPSLETSVNADGMREVTVSTVDELLAAIAPDTTVYLTAGEYNLSNATGYGSISNEYYFWTDTYDGPELVIHGVENFHLVGEGADSTSILTDPRYADVLSFEDSNNISLTGITAGHTQAPSPCSGGVLLFENTDAVLVTDCGLFGCGILGVTATDCADLQVVNTEIYDCTYGAADISACENVIFDNCDIHDCGNNNDFRVSDSTNVSCNGETLAA